MSYLRKGYWMNSRSATTYRLRSVSIFKPLSSSLNTLEHPQTSLDQTGSEAVRPICSEGASRRLEVWWRVAALRFFFVRTLKPREFREKLPYPKDSKDRRRLPAVLSLDEVDRHIDAAGNVLTGFHWCTAEI